MGGEKKEILLQAETIWTSSAHCRKSLNHAKAVSAVGDMQCHFHCRQQEQETESEKTFPVDTKPSVGAIHVPNNSVQGKKRKDFDALPYASIPTNRWQHFQLNKISV